MNSVKIVEAIPAYVRDVKGADVWSRRVLDPSRPSDEARLPEPRFDNEIAIRSIQIIERKKGSVLHRVVDEWIQSRQRQ